MGVQRKSSRGNPWHDYLGRFCKGPEAIAKRRDELESEMAEAEKENDEKRLDKLLKEKERLDDIMAHEITRYESSPEAYAKRTGDRIAKARGTEVNGVPSDEGTRYRVFYTGKDGRFYKDYTSESEMERDRAEEERKGNSYLTSTVLPGEGNTETTAYVVNEDGTYGVVSGKEIQEGMIVEYSPEWCAEGEEKFVHVVKEYYEDGFGERRARIRTLNSPISFGYTEIVTADMIRPAAKEKVDALSAGKCPKCGASLGEKDICPKCGFGYRKGAYDGIPIMDTKSGKVVGSAEVGNGEIKTTYFGGGRYVSEGEYTHEDEENGVKTVYYQEGGRYYRQRYESVGGKYKAHSGPHEMAREDYEEEMRELKDTKMPWDKDPAYKDHKNAKLLWLADHPEHKYNNPDMLDSIKKIQTAADMGASKITREKMFASLLKRYGLSREEGIELIGEEFLK